MEGKTVICGRIEVPENDDKSDGGRISLSFAVLKARTQSPAADPLIYLHGGPGGGAVRDLAGIVVPLWEGHRARRDVVTFDQRAAGMSSDMVTCFATFEQSFHDLFHTKQIDDAKQAAPDGVRSVFIDSVFPPNARAHDTSILPVQEGVQQVIDQCAADTGCAGAFPELEATIQRVAVKLEKTPISVAHSRPEINVQTLIALFEDRNSLGIGQIPRVLFP